MQKWCYEIEKFDKMGRDLDFSPFFFFFFWGGFVFEKWPFSCKMYTTCKWESGPLTSFLSLSLFSIMFQYINSNELSCQLTDGHWILISWWFHQSVNVWSGMMNQSILHFLSYLLEKHWTIRVRCSFHKSTKLCSSNSHLMLFKTCSIGIYIIQCFQLWRNKLETLNLILDTIILAIWCNDPKSDIMFLKYHSSHLFPCPGQSLQSWQCCQLLID